MTFGTTREDRIRLLPGTFKVELLTPKTKKCGAIETGEGMDMWPPIEWSGLNVSDLLCDVSCLPLL